jgi:hypothetical protein
MEAGSGRLQRSDRELFARSAGKGQFPDPRSMIQPQVIPD